MERLKLAITLALVLLASAAKGQSQIQNIIWADVDDIVRYAPKAMPDAKLIRDSVKKDARYTAGQAKFQFSPHFEALPETLSNSDTLYRAAAMMSGPTGELFYRKFEIELGGSPRKVVDVRAPSDIPLSSMHFQINTGLIDRMVVIEDVQNDIMLVLPIGVGGLDEGVAVHGPTRILTPRYKNASLERKNVQPKRTFPAYYRGKPFMPLTNSAGHVTPIAFHITILSDDDWNKRGPNYLVRGLESHACMRLRLKDLTEFFTIVMKGADEKLPVNVDYFVWNRNQFGERDQKQGEITQIHPYPLESNSYMTIKNFAGPGQKPIAQRDPEEHLLIMERVNHAPNLKHLGEFNADDITDMKVFDGLVIDMDKER